MEGATASSELLQAEIKKESKKVPVIPTLISESLVNKCITEYNLINQLYKPPCS
jgi:hypothetical protein